MKCPKCGYLGFETTERCRNCGYDFSLAVPSAGGELPLRTVEPDLGLVDLSLRSDDPDLDDASDAAEPRLALDNATGVARGGAERPDVPDVAAEPEVSRAVASVEELPLFAPRPAGPPLAVRRAGNEVPKARRTTTTRPARFEAPSLPLVAEVPAAEAPAPPSRQARAGRPEVAGPAVRVMAAVVDLVLLLGIDALVVWLTTRIAGLDFTREDLEVIRPLPMAGFFFVLAFLYLVGFTVGGGQTLGKMLVGIRVTGDDWHGVDLTGAVVRSLGAIASVCTLGLLFAPVFLTTERRTPYDKLAGTRVVVE